MPCYREKHRPLHKYSTSSFGLTSEMITKILHIIESAIHRIHPQNRLQPVFVKQEEFVFCELGQ